MAQVTGLSGNEIYCLALKQYSAGELVIGNSVNSMGFLGSLGASMSSALGGEVPQVTQAIQEGRQAAFTRLVKEAQTNGASGVAGVSAHLRAIHGSTEFLFVGSCLHGSTDGPFFTSAGDAQQLYCHMDAGYRPLNHVFGNIAYAMGVGGGLSGGLGAMARGEVREFSDVFNATRHIALGRLVNAARANKANAVVGIRTALCPWAHTHEMMMTGTAAIHPALPEQYTANPVTSDLTGEELWALSSLGYAPRKLLMSTSIYSLGLAQSFLATFKAFTRGEIPELTTLIHDARANAIGRLKDEADALGAEKVVGLKTFIGEIGSGLVEFVAVGTAVTKMDGMKVATPTLPAQAIIRDTDTWVSGDFGFRL